QIDKLSEQEAAFQENQDQLKDDYQKAQVALAEQEERLKNQREKTNTLKTQLNDYQEQYEIYANDLNELLDMQNSAETEEEIERKIASAKADKESITAEIQSMRSNRSERTQLLNDQDRELKEENKQHQAFKEAIQEKEDRKSVV